jgi:hypothetical protein
MAGPGQYRSRVSRNPIVGTPVGWQGSKAVGVACLELGVSVSDFGDGQFYLSRIGGCTPDRVIWLATLFHRGVRGEIMIGISAGERDRHFADGSTVTVMDL